MTFVKLEDNKEKHRIRLIILVGQAEKCHNVAV